MPETFYLAEWYRTEMTSRVLGTFAALVESTAESMVADFPPIRLVVTLSVPADDALYGIFVAEMPEHILRTCSRMGVLPHRLTPQVHAWIAPGAQSA